jgi:hypothetical protein
MALGQDIPYISGPPLWVGTYFRNRPLRDVTLQNKKAYKQRGVSHGGLAIYIIKHLNAKEELWKLNISPCKNIIFKKIL